MRQATIQRDTLETQITIQINLDGTGKAKIDPPKAMLGAVAGGAVCVAQGAGPVGWAGLRGDPME